MSRLVEYLGIIVVIATVFFITALPNVSVVERDSPPVAVLEVTASELVATSSPETSVVATSSVAAPAPVVRPAEVVPKVAVAIPAPAEPAPAPAPPPVPTNAELDAAAAALREALVNILCYTPAGSGLHSISGSGVFINPKGIILTNAHVAQYLLLADRGAFCVIRAGSPAVDKYKAALIYISPLWLRANETILTEANPSGNGEYDFALLAVTKSANSAALPSSFPFVPLATRPSFPGTPVVIASYGAQFIESSQIRFSLFPTIVFGSVKNVYTFKTNTIDVLALGGSAAAQEGSSGGGVADGNGELVATITTSTVTGNTDTRLLDAITASYIRAAYASETGSALDLLLAEPTASAVAEFAPQIPALAAIITANLP